MSFASLLDGIRQLFVWWCIVAPWEQAVRVRLGRHVRLLQPGIYLVIPMVDRVYTQGVRLRTDDVGIQTLQGLDGKTVMIATCVKYEIRDMLLLFRTVQDVHSTVVDLVASAVASVVTAARVGDLTPALIEESAARAVNLERFGLGNVAVQVTDFATVRTYRLVSDNRAPRCGFGLNTVMHDRDPRR